MAAIDIRHFPRSEVQAQQLYLPEGRLWVAQFAVDAAIATGDVIYHKEPQEITRDELSVATCPVDWEGSSSDGFTEVRVSVEVDELCDLIGVDSDDDQLPRRELKVLVNNLQGNLRECMMDSEAMRTFAPHLGRVMLGTDLMIPWVTDVSLSGWGHPVSRQNLLVPNSNNPSGWMFNRAD